MAVSDKALNHELLKLEKDWVLKPVQKPPRGDRELLFYRRAFADNAGDELTSLRPFLCRFVGEHTTDEGRRYLKLEDVTAGFDRPCWLDYKLGRQTWDPLADGAKVEYQLTKYRGTRPLGFCLPGFKVYDLSGEAYTTRGKGYGKALTASNYIDAFVEFFNVKSAEASPNIKSNVHGVVKTLRDRLAGLIRWSESQQSFKFYACSLLVVYGAEGLTAEPEAACPSGPLPDLRLIDFAHVFSADDDCFEPGVDENVLQSLRFLDGVFGELLSM